MLFVWGKWLPYHFARVQACAEHFRAAGYSVVGVQYSDVSIDYRINSSARLIDFAFLNPHLGKHETDFRPLRIIKCWPRLLARHSVKVVFVPSYWHWSATIAAVSRVCGCRVIMMNESHAGTEQATGWRKKIKRQLIRLFDAALVGGEPHKRHFAALGIPADKIFMGYDAVDNDFFASRADEIRAAAKESGSVSAFAAANGSGVTSSGQVPSIREAYGLPDRYFLSLGRMVEKKNLATLVAAYAKYCDESRVASGESGRQKPVALVFVGSGELEGALREQARSLGLRVVDRTEWKAGESSHGLTRINTDKSERLAADRTEGNADCRMASTAGGLSPETTDGEDAAATKTRDSLPATSHEENCGTVFFYGFRQIEENPVFYALAEVFVLPSLNEEWGLVVNEAMACSLPVIVSRTAGCAEDLLPGSESWQCSVGSIQSGEEKRTDDCKLVANGSLEQRSNGFVFDPKSSDALSEALRRIADQKTKSLTAESSRQPEAKPRANQETDGLTDMGRRSREIVERFSCENFAQQAMLAADAASEG